MSIELNILIKQISQGNESAFRTFYDLYYARLYRYAFKFIQSDFLCEELISDVYVKIWNNRKNLVQIENFKFYLYVSVKNQALTYLRRKSKTDHHIDIDAAESLLVEINQPDDLLISQELANLIEEAINSLPNRCGIIFRLIREDGLSYKQVSELLEISEKTISSQMMIATKKIRNIIDVYYQKNNDTARRNTAYFIFLIC